jgi:hypothetical protein
VNLTGARLYGIEIDNFVTSCTTFGSVCVDDGSLGERQAVCSEISMLQLSSSPSKKLGAFCGFLNYQNQTNDDEVESQPERYRAG